MVVASVIGAGSVSVASAGIGIAASRTSTTIHGCVAKSSGALRIVKHVSSCNKSERPLSFNARGPRGLAAPKPATFQMFANVDAEGQLGSHYDASAATEFSGGIYVVTFTKPVSHCAVAAQPGEATGSEADADVSVVEPNTSDPRHRLLVQFFNDGNLDSTSFMLTATCLA